VRELQLHHALPEIGRAVLATAARCSCVVVAAGAFAALDTHCSAVHVRLRAPFDWRVTQYARENLVNHHCAEKAVRDDDHRKRAWIKSMYHVDINEAKNFSVAIDVSRFSHDRVVEMLLAAGGVSVGAPALVEVGDS
jgi:cytidylate kinase